MCFFWVHTLTSLSFGLPFILFRVLGTRFHFLSWSFVPLPLLWLLLVVAGFNISLKRILHSTVSWVLGTRYRFRALLASMRVLFQVWSPALACFGSIGFSSIPHSFACPHHFVGPLLPQLCRLSQSHFLIFTVRCLKRRFRGFATSLVDLWFGLGYLASFQFNSTFRRLSNRRTLLTLHAHSFTLPFRRSCISSLRSCISSL